MIELVSQDSHAFFFIESGSCTERQRNSEMRPHRVFRMETKVIKIMTVNMQVDTVISNGKCYLKHRGW